MQSFLSDLRYALRELRHRPGFALTAVLSLALGIGATSAVFSVIYGVLLESVPVQGLPPDDADRDGWTRPARFRYAGHERRAVR